MARTQREVRTATDPSPRLIALPFELVYHPRTPHSRRAALRNRE